MPDLSRHVSSKPARFEDGSQFFYHLSSKQTFFEDRPPLTVAFYAGSGRAPVMLESGIPCPAKASIQSISIDI